MFVNEPAGLCCPLMQVHLAQCAICVQKDIHICLMAKCIILSCICIRNITFTVFKDYQVQLFICLLIGGLDSKMSGVQSLNNLYSFEQNISG